MKEGFIRNISGTNTGKKVLTYRGHLRIYFCLFVLVWIKKHGDYIYLCVSFVPIGYFFLVLYTRC